MAPAHALTVREYAQADAAWAETLTAEFGGRLQARRGEVVDVLALPGLVAEAEGRRIGLLTYRVDGDECELAFVMATERFRGAGSALLEALRGRAEGCRLIWLVTTNDNVDAIRFYQRRGFVLRALRPGAVDEARRLLKPSIPALGDHGIPLRDELELELPLA